MLSLGPEPGTRALVVGGCGGIGRVYVEGLLALGCRVAVIDRKSAVQASPPPKDATVVVADASDSAQFSTAFGKAVSSLDGLDLMAHLVGCNPTQSTLLETDSADIDSIFAINLQSAINASRLAIDAMGDNPGSMVFVSSGLAQMPEPGFGPYAMSKAALNAMVKTLARECAPTIRCNAVAPGLVETEFLSGGTGGGGVAGGLGDLNKLGAQAERIVASIPTGRIATPSEVAAPMLFRSSPGAAHITGQIMYVNGGRFMP